jgi:hypothetical protein
VRITFPASLGGTKVRLIVTTEGYDFGAPISIELPPDEEIADRPVDLRTLFATTAPGGN